MGLMKALGWRLRPSMRVLSPKMLPWCLLLEGSTASTATLTPDSAQRRPKASVSVLLPAPGFPVIPKRKLPCGGGPRQSKSPAARCMSSGKWLSTRLRARPIKARSPRRIPSAHSGAVQTGPFMNSTFRLRRGASAPSSAGWLQIQEPAFRGQKLQKHLLRATIRSLGEE